MWYPVVVRRTKSFLNTVERSLPHHFADELNKLEKEKDGKVVVHVTLVDNPETIESVVSVYTREELKAYYESKA